MSFENPGMNPAEETYEAQGLEGPALDFEKIFNSADRKEALSENPEAANFYNEVIDVINTDNYLPEGAHTEDIVRAIRQAAKDGGWKSYDEVRFKDIRNELQKAGIPLKERKTASDF